MQGPDSTDPLEAHRWRDLQRQQLAQINTTIAELGSEFESDVPEFLDTERRELETTLSSFSYPVHDAPVEIIRHILIHCLPADGRVRPLPHLAPLLLVQICQRWREIALSTFQLWSSLDFTFHGGSPRQRKFGRTNGYPLSLTLRCSTNRKGIPHAFYAAISKYSGQWQRLEIAFPGADLRAFRHHVEGPFPLLSRLSLHGHQQIRAGDLQAFRNTPQLRDVRLLEGLTLSNVPIGGAALTNLEIDLSISMTDCTTIFQSFPTLVHLKLSVASYLQPSVFGPIENPPPLESLHMDCRSLLDALTLPHLRRLRYTYTICDQAQITAVFSFISRSACVINDLALRVSDIEDYSLVEFLRTIPSIEVLQLDYTPSLTPRTVYGHLESTTLLPRLRELSVSETVPGAPADRYRYDPLVKMLQARGRSRRGGPHRIHLYSFELTLTPTRFSGALDERCVLPQSIHAEKIGRLIKGGLRFRVHGARLEWPVLSSPNDELEFPAYRPSDQTSNAV
ncbi:hypothetical protein B0H11DRAFT_2282593 [Mycena galericulata]|nr:hypothetical protein B0H11DRAFT_2282593 [Mycena galericulata]